MMTERRESLHLAWLVALVGYLGVLVWLIASANGGEPVAQRSVWELQQGSTRQEWLGLARDLALRALRAALVIAPLGVFAALTMPRRKTFLGRSLAVFLPGAVLALVAGYVALTLGGGGAGPARSLWALAAGAGGALLGAAMGTAASRGPLALLLFFPKLALLTLVSGVAAVYLATSPAPFDIEGPRVSSSDRRHLVQLFRGHNPMKLREGETRALVVTSRDLELMLASGFSLIGARPPITVETGTHNALIQMSAHVPYLDRFVNVLVRLRLHVDHGVLDLGISQLRIGALSMPGPIRELIAVVAETIVQRDETVSPVLAGVDELLLGDLGVAVSYRRMELGGKFLPNVLARLGPDAEVLAAARAQLAHLADHAPDWAGSDTVFETSIQSAFALARQRSETSNPIVENSGAILALSIVLGHPQLSVFAGLESEERNFRLARRALGRVRLRGRRDWTQHFFVSAGLMQLSSVAVSDAVGLLKEELDADMDEGGSGFSFADLLADRAGTMFARAATLDASRASQLQERLAAGVDVSDLFPEADGLREGIADDVLTAEYGGVGGAGYRAVIQDIEQRLSRCELLQ